jgi:hypothetical protein
MRVSLICPTCAQAAGGVGTWFVDTIREDGLYTGKCPNGHDLLLATQTLPHEMLFEIALNAITDGYNREAVSSFAASMERFFEFAIRVIANKHAVPADALADMWKIVAKQSERQLGAYVLLYGIEFAKSPHLLSNKMTELRNDVVHKGKLPSRKEALGFGSAVYEVIQESVRQLRTTHLDQVNGCLGEHVARIAEKMGAVYPRTFQVTSTVLNIIDDVSSGYKPFSQVLLERGISSTA